VRVKLFAAILPPPETVAELERALPAVRALPEAERLRWTDPVGWHITLAYYGETPAGHLPALTAGLAAGARASEPFGLRLAGGGTFGTWVLWAGLGGATAELVALAKRAATAAPVIDPPDTCTPHVTLAFGDGEPPLGPYAAALSGFTGTPWTAGELVLMRVGGGHRYARQAGWPLGVP
jgi:2'-5' RNA ligase